MLAVPDGLTDEMVAVALEQGWGVRTASLSYLAVGFGSHHWDVTDDTGARWFASVDELDTRRWSLKEPLDSVFGRLDAGLTAAADLAGLGLRFVLAPTRARNRRALLRLAERFSVALTPFAAGQSFGWGDFDSAEHRRAVLDLVIAVHGAPASARRHARADDLTIAFRDALDAALDGGLTTAGGGGPYGARTAALIGANRGALARLLGYYDALAERALACGGPLVLTHGEPHPGNTMRTTDGWVLIDWDTTLVARPERDLSVVDPGDGTMLAAYHEITGVRPMAEVAELYRLRWELTDIAITTAQFSQPHDDNANNAEAFALLEPQLERLSRRDQPRSGW
jgi:spectinomycin phosphotransferase/16S rRNA (guanine(1405)-N(7))-methyltransferase